MKKLLVLILISFSTLIFPSEKKIVINNRVMTVINGKPISVMDIAKKMDIQFLKEFPNRINNSEARYEYYRQNWQIVFNDLIDHDLIIQDSLEKGMDISDGDIKEEMEDLFGSNALETIQNMNMTYKEAREMVKDNIIVRRMMMYTVHNKSLKKIGPQDILLAYEDYLQQMENNDKWQYAVITFHNDSINNSFKIARKAHTLLTEKKSSMETLQKDLNNNPEKVEVKISSIYDHDRETVSEANRSILSKMSPKSYSLPQLQPSRSNKLGVYRILYLKDFQKSEIAPLEEMETDIKNYLVNAVSRNEYQNYLLKLRNYYNIDLKQVAKTLPDNFQPFVIK